MRSKLNLELKNELPLFALLNYLINLDDLYYKYLTIEKLIDLYEMKLNEPIIFPKKRYTDYLLGKPKTVLFDQTYINVLIDEKIEIDNKIMKNDKNKLSSNLYERIIRTKHPRLVYEKNNLFYDLIDDYSEDELVLKELKVNSPPLISFDGVDKILKQVVYGDNIERREQEIHEGKVVQQTLDNMERYISLSERLDNSQISNEHKAYIREVLKSTEAKQKRLVDEIEYQRIDFKG
jgi:hypothetical protein